MLTGRKLLVGDCRAVVVPRYERSSWAGTRPGAFSWRGTTESGDRTFRPGQSLMCVPDVKVTFRPGHANVDQQGAGRLQGVSCTLAGLRDRRCVLSKFWEKGLFFGGGQSEQDAPLLPPAAEGERLRQLPQGIFHALQI